MLLDHLIDIFFIDIRGPDACLIHDDARPFLATIKAPRLVDPYLARPRKSERLDALLRVIAHAVRALVGAARALARWTAIAAEEHVMLVVGPPIHCTHLLFAGIAPSRRNQALHATVIRSPDP